MARILIIGIGNVLRSDDGVGWQVVQEISEQSSASDVQFILVQQLTPEIADSVSRADRALFVDAARGGTPGSVYAGPILPAKESSTPSHDLSIASVLKLARDLYHRSPTAYALTVSGESFEVGEDLSPAVREALPTLREAIERFIERGELLIRNQV